ncbi:Hypothetical protein, putative [Bodo saltans]|uniref:Uncharacterized protein n=1 Tax=Bodo saltans TaxID=75058 RepID=A0A0S4JUC9_BODSA|nr:Hypothetical protein, putative [Bodo saltans]|eukprot:CUG92704.1 Hypothetical protein, putative [Bodo saltans]
MTNFLSGNTLAAVPSVGTVCRHPRQGKVAGVGRHEDGHHLSRGHFGFLLPQTQRSWMEVCHSITATSSGRMWRRRLLRAVMTAARVLLGSTIGGFASPSTAALPGWLRGTPRHGAFHISGGGFPLKQPYSISLLGNSAMSPMMGSLASRVKQRQQHAATFRATGASSLTSTTEPEVSHNDALSLDGLQTQQSDDNNLDENKR